MQASLLLGPSKEVESVLNKIRIRCTNCTNDNTGYLDEEYMAHYHRVHVLGSSPYTDAPVKQK